MLGHVCISISDERRDSELYSHGAFGLLEGFPEIVSLPKLGPSMALWFSLKLFPLVLGKDTAWFCLHRVVSLGTVEVDKFGYVGKTLHHRVREASHSEIVQAFRGSRARWRVGGCVTGAGLHFLLESLSRLYFLGLALSLVLCLSFLGRGLFVRVLAGSTLLLVALLLGLLPQGIFFPQGLFSRGLCASYLLVRGLLVQGRLMRRLLDSRSLETGLPARRLLAARLPILCVRCSCLVMSSLRDLLGFVQHELVV